MHSGKCESDVITVQLDDDKAMKEFLDKKGQDRWWPVSILPTIGTIRTFTVTFVRGISGPDDSAKLALIEKILASHDPEGYIKVSALADALK